MRALQDGNKKIDNFEFASFVKRLGFEASSWNSITARASPIRRPCSAHPPHTPPRFSTKKSRFHWFGALGAPLR